MAKKFKTIILSMKKTQVEFKDVDGWLIDLRYLVRGKETYSAQILKPDLQSRISQLEKEGFKKL